MEHKFIQRVYYSDTDAYGVVWHGSYLRWMEMGRVYWTEMKGLGLADLRDNHDIVIPVAGINIKYKIFTKFFINIFQKKKTIYNYSILS